MGTSGAVGAATLSHQKTAGSPATSCPLLTWMVFAAVIFLTLQSGAQNEPHERTFRQSKSAVEHALKELQPSMSGHLPALEGFALAGDHPLSRYQRAFYQSVVQVNSTPAGGAVVRVSTKVTAWYADSVASRSGYQLVASNGRLESDLLDQLSEALTSTATAVGPLEKKPSARSSTGSTDHAFPEPTPAAPLTSPASNGTFSLGAGLSAQQLADSKNAGKPLDPTASSLQAEAATLEEVLKNLAHPKNLVAIKKSGTPVVASPSLNGKNLFLATAHDEFEMLDFNADWVHVRISGLSRGWIWRTSLEMPDGISDVPQNGAKSTLVAADLFQVTREETAPFPGDWGPLRGKNVRIISVQKIQENEKDSGAPAKLEFAKSLIDRNYSDLAAKAQELSGIVLIFDSVDGGMIAATIPTVQQWKAGTLSDAALWHQCYFDPPETFSVSASGGSN
jgi:hypothetical protein